MPAFAAADCIEEVIVEKGEGGGSGLAGLRERRLFLLLRADAEFVVGAKAGFESGVGAEASGASSIPTRTSMAATTSSTSTSS